MSCLRVIRHECLLRNQSYLNHLVSPAVAAEYYFSAAILFTGCEYCGYLSGELQQKCLLLFIHCDVPGGVGTETTENCIYVQLQAL